MHFTVPEQGRVHLQYVRSILPISKYQPVADLMDTLQDAKQVAEAFGYTKEQLNSIPEGSHMGLSCGNPVATANIKEVILIPDPFFISSFCNVCLP